MRHTSSSSTGRTSRGSLKSHTGGSMNARCPFSPIPMITRHGSAAPQQPRISRALGLGVRRLAIQSVKRRHRHVVEQTLPQESPERRRMVRRHPRVLIHMESRDARPIHFLRAQRRQERILRHGRREHHRRPPRARDLIPHDPRRDLRPRRPGFAPVRENPHFQPVPIKRLLVYAHEITIADHPPSSHAR